MLAFLSIIYYTPFAQWIEHGELRHMPARARSKQERIIEAVRLGLQGDDAVEFLHQSGFAMTQAGIARRLRSIGGRGRVQELIDTGKSNIEILEICFTSDPDESRSHASTPSQGELFPVADNLLEVFHTGLSLYAGRKMAIKMPDDLYEALRMAARVENKNMNELIIEILTSEMSRFPRFPEEE